MLKERTIISPEELAKAEQKSAGREFLSKVKDIIRNHAGIEPKVLYGNDVFPKGTFQTKAATLAIEGENRTFQVEATFDRRPSALSAHIVNATLKEKGKEPIIVEQDTSEPQYLKANEASLPSLQDLTNSGKILEKLRTHYNHQSR